MTAESTFRAIALANVAVCLPIGIYFRLRSHATREKLDRRQEGVFTLVATRLCGLLAWTVFAAYLIDPAFVAQHATATCCRVCLEKWHAIPKGRELNAAEEAHILAVIRRWLTSQQRT